MPDDHPARGPHVECLVDHGGRGVPRHCKRGCMWPCPNASKKHDVVVAFGSAGPRLACHCGWETPFTENWRSDKERHEHG